MRNVLTKLPKKNTQAVRTEIKNLFKINDLDAARIAKENIIKQYETSYPNMCACLDDGFEESF